MRKKSILTIVSSIVLIGSLTMNNFTGMQKVNAEELLPETVETSNSADDILENGKEILYFTLYTKDNSIATDLEDNGFTNDQIESIKKIALEQFNYTTSMKSLYDGKTSDMDVAEYNNAILLESQSVENEIKSILNDQYDSFVSYLTEYWNDMCASRSISTCDLDTSDDQDIEVYATQFDIDDYCVAMPDKYLKFANLGWDYTYSNPTYSVNLISYNKGTEVDGVPVNDVGPWNELDDYWHVSRWEFCDLELGLPEAEAAYFDNYNDGCDDEGRIVSNPTGIDLSPSVASDLGFGYYESGWISIHLNF